MEQLMEVRLTAGECPQTAEKLKTAARAARVLSRTPDIDAVVLFGSVARGRATPASDIDLLVVGSTDVTTYAVRRSVHRPNVASVNVAFRSRAAFRRLLARGDSFAAHLHHEAIVLFDRSDWVTPMLRRPLPHGSLAEEVASHLQRLGPLEDLRQFGDYFVFCYARVYAVAKAVVIAIVCQHGYPVFDRYQAFARFAELYPALRRELALISELAPYYEAVSRDGDVVLPEPFEGPSARRRARRALTAVKTIAHAA